MITRGWRRFSEVTEQMRGHYDKPMDRPIRSFMKIPKSLQLHGQTIKVVHDNQLEHMTGSIGEARYRENQIVLQPNNKGINFPETKLEQVYCHELIHFIL